MESKNNNTFINNTNDYINTIINVLNIKIKEDGTLRECRKMTYRDGEELQSVTYTLVFLVNTEKIFKETIGFDIYINEETDFIKVTEQFTNDTKLFSKKDFIKTSDFVISKIIKKRVKKDYFMNINSK